MTEVNDRFRQSDRAVRERKPDESGETSDRDGSFPARGEGLEDVVREVVNDEFAATDSNGRRATLGSLLEFGFSRRHALVVLGLVASGSLLSTAITQTMAGGVGDGPADASSSSVHPPMHSAGDGNVVPHGLGLDTTDAVDPAETTTPVQDALDTVADAGGGLVVLPPERIVEAETIRFPSSVALRGFWGKSTIAFPPGTDGIHIDPEYTNSAGGYVVFCDIDGVTLEGPGHDERDSGTAIRDRGLWLSRFGKVAFREWNGPVWIVEEDAGSFDNRFEYVYITNCDAGRATEQGDGLITWRSYGATNYVGYLSAFPIAKHSGTHSRILATEGMAAHVDGINAGNDSGPVLSGYYNSMNIGTVHWEPTGQPSPAEAIFELVDDTPFSLGHLTLNSNAATRYAYSVTSGGHMRLPIPYAADNARIIENSLRLRTDPASHIRYDGPSSDVTVNGPGGTHRCHCLSDFTSVG